MIKLTNILEEIVSKRLQYLREDDAEKKPAKPRKKKSADKPTEPVDEPVDEPVEEPTEPDAGTPTDTKKAERGDAKPKTIRVKRFHYPPTPEQEKVGTVQGMKYPPGTIKPKTFKLGKRSAQQSKEDDAQFVEPGKTPDAPKSVGDELRDYFRSMLKKADGKDAANAKKMQGLLDRDKERAEKTRQANIDAAKDEFAKWEADKAARNAAEKEKRAAKQAAGKVRIKSGNITDPDTDERSKKDYITDPKTGLLVLPSDDPTNLDITKYNPKAVDAVSAAYQRFLRSNPSDSQAMDYLRLLLRKNKLPPQFGTAKQSKKFSGGNDAV